MLNEWKCVVLAYNLKIKWICKLLKQIKNKLYVFSKLALTCSNGSES